MKLLLCCVLALLVASVPADAQSPSERAKALLAKMSLADKITMVHGAGGPYVGNIAGNPSLSIPPINMNDGPQGFRCQSCAQGSSTQWPSGLTAAASWDRNAMNMWGSGMGREFRAKGANVQLGPGLCLARVPQCGRNFEYLSGEDPYLGYSLVQPVITGIQSHGVIANAKHFINNNQETNRQYISEDLDERTEWEMYMQPFVGAVESGVLSIMCSYNKINSTWSCENPRTLGYLKNTANFTGWVMSDWGATHSTIQSAMAGLDQQMPDDSFFGQPLADAVSNGSVPMSVLDDKVLRITTAMFTIGLFDTPTGGNISANVTSVEHNRLARYLSGQSTVLMKNDIPQGESSALLPLDESSIKTIAVLGNAGDLTPITGGDGSGYVGPPYQITGLEGIKARVGKGINVTYHPSTPLDAAVAAAKAADIAIVYTGTISTEGADRVNLSLPLVDDELISAVAKIQPKTVVVMAVPGATLTPWRDSVPAILNQFMPGQEAGNAAADVLFGDVNPSARLPLTFPVTENDQQMTQSQWPGLPASNPTQATYSEGLFFGYRWYDQHNVAPAFPFGHGLSYTTFDYVTSSVEMFKAGAGDNIVATVTIVVNNTGALEGAEVAQLYLQYPAASQEPPKVLRGFDKVFLAPSEARKIEFSLTEKDVSVWDSSSHGWVKQSGTFTYFVGASSRDIRLQGTFQV